MRRWQRFGVVAVTLVGMAACGGSGGADDAAAPDLAGVDVLDTAPEAGPAEVAADVAPDEQVAPAGWMPAEPVDAQLVFPELTSSEGLAVDGEGRFLLTANDALMRLAPGGVPEVLAAIPKAPDQLVVGYAGVAWHPSWGAVFAQTSGNRLYRWTEADGLALIGDPIGSGPNGVLFDGEGHCLVSLSAENSVVRLDTPESTPVTIATGIPFANGLALSGDGATLYVASTSKGAIYQVPLGGEPPHAANVLSDHALFAGADGLVMAPDGWLLVASWGKGRIVALDVATNEARVVSDAPAENLKFVASLAFGPGGDLEPRCLFGTRLHLPGLVKVCP